MKYEFSDDDIIRLKDDADYTVIFTWCYRSKRHNW